MKRILILAVVMAAIFGATSAWAATSGNADAVITIQNVFSIDVSAAAVAIPVDMTGFGNDGTHPYPNSGTPAVTIHSDWNATTLTAVATDITATQSGGGPATPDGTISLDIQKYDSAGALNGSYGTLITNNVHNATPTLLFTSPAGAGFEGPLSLQLNARDITVADDVGTYTTTITYTIAHS